MHRHNIYIYCAIHIPITHHMNIPLCSGTEFDYQRKENKDASRINHQGRFKGVQK